MSEPVKKCVINQYNTILFTGIRGGFRVMNPPGPQKVPRCTSWANNNFLLIRISKQMFEFKEFCDECKSFFSGFRIVLFLISLQLCALIKFCYELNFFLLVFGEFLFMISIQMCELIMFCSLFESFVPHFNACLSTNTILFRSEYSFSNFNTNA